MWPASSVLAHRVAITLEACHAREIIEEALARYSTPEQAYLSLLPRLDRLHKMKFVVRPEFPTAAFLAHPNRFQSKNPQPPTMPMAAWFNPPQKETITAPNQ